MESPSPELSFTLVTSTDLELGVIRHELKSTEKRLFEWLTNTREESFRKSLIALGWTPPAEDQK